MNEMTNTTNVATIDAATAAALQQIEAGQATLVPAPKKKVSGKQVAVTAGIGAASAGAGFVAGYLVKKYKDTKKFEEQLEDMENAIATLAEEVVKIKKGEVVEDDEDFYEVEDEPEETPQQPEKKADKKADDKK